MPATFLLRDLGDRQGDWVDREGDLALGGVSWRGKTPALGQRVEDRFRLPRVPRELRAEGEILRAAKRSGGIDFHVRFTELDNASELCIARYLDEFDKGG
ncbi:MAG: PilZ domain-containing protein [Deltaproteobacteria bacterium]|nr:PilZ domain-containing protein [Deltaproteobacteria bacterium]